MPTNYNFQNKPNYFDLRLPNKSGNAKFIEYYRISPQPIITLSLDSSNKSPTGLDSAKFELNTTQASSWDLLNFSGFSNNADSDVVMTSLSDLFPISFWAKTSGPTLFMDARYTTSDGGSFGSPDVALTSTWTYFTLSTNTFVTTNNIGKRIWFGLRVGTPASAGTTIWLSDLTFTKNSDPTTTTSFDNQFIPADTFRQGNLYGSGANDNSVMGTNNTIDRSTPSKEFTSSTNWRHVSAGFYFVSAIKTDGTLWTWGDEFYGALGVNDSVARRTPVREFTSSSNWVSLSAGYDHMCAIKSDGTLWCWGRNNFGQLGINNTITMSTPVQEFTSSTNWKDVYCFTTNTLALKNDGTLWEFGSAVLGRWVDGILYKSTPVQEFTSSTNWKKVQSGLALKTDNTLWTWGNGALGVPSGVIYSSPILYSNTILWKDISQDSQTSHGIQVNGSLWSWGRGDSGQMGNNTTTISNNNPVREFTSSTNWAKVFGGDSVGAIKTDGTLWVWGRNDLGQLGLNFRSPGVGGGVLTPVPMQSDVKNWKQFSNNGSNVGHCHFLSYIDPVI